MSDLQPSLEVLGVYQVPWNEHDLREQLRRFYFFGNSVKDYPDSVGKRVETCFPLVLFEITLESLDERFRIAHFTQEMPNAPTKAWQCAYDEAVLSADGTRVTARNPRCTSRLRRGRIAFYFHYYDPGRPMLWTYGEFTGPAVQLLPRRLRKILPYLPVD